MDIPGSKNKRSDITPTPTNTPVPTAPIYSRPPPAASKETVPSPKMGKNKNSPRKGRQPAEEEEEIEDDVSELLARNPDLAAAIQERVGSLMSQQNSTQSLPAEVKRRVKALKNLQGQHAKLEADFREELLALERKYLDKFKPLYDKRVQITSGEVEPTDEECEREDSDIEEGLQNATIQELDDNEKPVSSTKGVSAFWYTAMMNHPMLAEIIQEQDFPALKQLRDITVHFVEDNHGFVITFAFDENEFFTNKTLTKTYYLQNNVGSEYEDLIYSRSEGCTIDWKKDKNLTVRVETKKQRHKGSKKTRVVKREIPTESFFNFFSPPKMPSDNDEDDEEVGGELEERIEQDFELGEVFKTRLVRHAVDWFTGKALENYEEDGPYGEDEYGDEDDDQEDEEDEDDEEEASGTTSSKVVGEKPADCQQQ